MAEARSAVGRLRVLPNLEEGRDSWKDIYNAIRKSFVRRYYRTRNSIRNGTWPTSTNNLTTVFIIILSLLLGEPDVTDSLNKRLWNFSYNLPIPEGTPKWLRAFLTAWVIGCVFFVAVMKIRQYILRALLSYRGWLYENLKSQSLKTLLWGILVKTISGYSPSLYSCQRSLPRLPVPKLHTTLNLLLESLKPLCSDSELNELRLEAQEFEKSSVGKNLQNILILRSWWVPNYVTEWWEKYVYLMSRSPLAINSNYYGMDQSYWTPTPHQTVRAATAIHNVLVFKRMIDREELPPLVLRNTIPICMAQYERLLSSIRIPGDQIDEYKHYDSAESKHIIVNYRGLMYNVECYDAKNQILSPPSIQSQLEWLIKDAETQLKTGEISESARSISALTTLPRSEWAKIWKTHFGDGINKDSIEEVCKAIFMVSLSDSSPSTLNEKGKLLIHSDGKSLWFDKSVNMIFFKNGHCGLNVEHTIADAPVMGHIWEYAMTKDIIEKWYTDDGQCMPMTKAFRQAAVKTPVRIDWSVNAELEVEINQAIIFAEKNNADLDLEIGDHNKWGKGLIKKCKVSPDAFIQIALQLAYYKDAQKFVQTYEASMTRLYLSGRTETVRSCTQETTEFVRAMVRDSLSKEEKIKLMQKAADKHQQLYRDAMNGKGIDRHLFALYVCCKGLSYESPFLEKIINRSWTLSTSQQPQQQLSDVPDANLKMFQDKVCPGGGFGPVSDTGYGVSYMLPSDHKIFFHVTSKHSCSETSSKRFVQNIFESMNDLRKLFDLEVI